MSLEEQLKQEILSRYKSIRAFTTTIDIPYSTLDSVFKRGIANAGVSTMIKVFDALDLDIESVQSGELIAKPHKDLDSELNTSKNLNKDEQAHIKKYRLLDPYGKEAVDSILDVEHRRCEAARATAIRESRE